MLGEKVQVRLDFGLTRYKADWSGGEYTRQIGVLGDDVDCSVGVNVQGRQECWRIR